MATKLMVEDDPANLKPARFLPEAGIADYPASRPPATADLPAAPSGHSFQASNRTPSRSIERLPP